MEKNSKDINCDECIHNHFFTVLVIIVEAIIAIAKPKNYLEESPSIM